MKLHSEMSLQPIRRIAFVCICTLAIYGCSGSSGSGSDEVQSSVASETDLLPDAVVTPVSDAQPSMTPTVDTDNPSDTENPSSETLSDTSSPATDAQPTTVAPEPLPTPTTEVTFDITVPAYMSNELQVRLESGDINTTATFVSDESWSASAVFPVNTDNPVLVTFSDGNGAITLGTVDTVFRTNTATSQSIQITADQFDISRWDNDNDGISNLDELIGGTNPNGDDVLTPDQLPSMPLVSLELVQDKTLRINWQASANANTYRVLENLDGTSGFAPISEDLVASTRMFDHRVALFASTNTRFIVQACNTNGCVDSNALTVSGTLDNAIGYFKGSNRPEQNDSFGTSVSVSADGNTLAVGARFGRSDEADDSVPRSGAVYIFVRSDGPWQLQTQLKVDDAETFDRFGLSVSLSADGNTLAVGADGEDSAAIGINGDQSDNSAVESGAVYVFVRSDELWQQQAYLKASNTDIGDNFGYSIHLSADGNTLAIGANSEASLATGINGNQADNSAGGAGAVYVFSRNDELWRQQAYVKASNTDASDEFGESVSLSADGNTLAVGARSENSAATGINGDQTDNSALGSNSGAVYVLVRVDGVWQQQAYIKASNTGGGDSFGVSVSVSADGNTLAVGADFEDSIATGVNADLADNSAPDSGAVYVFVRSGLVWQQQASLKASNTDGGDSFGRSISLSADGNALVVGSGSEDSIAIGINGNQTDNSASVAGAVYVFVRGAGLWQQGAYVKASNTEGSDGFGRALSMSADGNTLAVGASLEDSGAIGINGDQTDNSAVDTGAVYLY